MRVYKQAALHLHGLNEADRQWLLDQLPVRQRENLLPLLEELNALGIPRERVLLDELNLTGTGTGTGERKAAAAEISYIRYISDRSPTDIAVALNEEADGIVAAVLSVYDWPFQRAYLQSLSAERRCSVQESVNKIQNQLSARVREALLKTLYNRLLALPQTCAWSETPAVDNKLGRDGADASSSHRRWWKPIKSWWNPIRRLAWQR